ncbi:MAG: alpha/beta hydrolase [Anaerolineae bacterium]|nr:alpha/beta hydrolase [Anaerolineae bacterium]
MTRKRAIRLLLVGVPLLLILAYLAVAWSLSSIILAPFRRTLSEVCEMVELFPNCARQQLAPQLAQTYGLPLAQDVQLATEDGLVLNGWYFDNPIDGDCAVLLLHGFRMNRLEPAVLYGGYFTARGCDLLAYDARAHGESGGTFATFGYYEHDDARLAVGWLAEHADVPVTQIGLVGDSYGAATALLTAAQEPAIPFVIADSTYTDLYRIFGYQAEIGYGPIMRALFLDSGMLLAGWRGSFVPGSVAPIDAITQVDAPILLIHSMQDTFTLPEHSQDLLAVADPARTVLHLTDWGAEHAQSCLIRPADCHAYFDDFLAVYVPDFGLTP